jgi:tRNA uridine 5-carboxymethylaminomethyl modification enzyme
VGDSDWERFNSRRDRIAGLRNALDLTRFTRSAVEYATVSRILGVDLGDAFTLGQLAVRPGVERELVHRLLPEAVRSGIQPADLDTALADSLYSGYIEKQRAASERVNHHDSLKVPADFQFTTVGGLSHEMIERLERARPKNFAQVRSIAGLTPAAVSAVLVHLTSHQSFSTPG